VKKIFPLILLLTASYTYTIAQQKYIKGRVLLNDQTATGVYVQVLSVKNNSTVAFDASQANGNYEINIDTNYSKVTIRISHIGYTTIDTLVSLSNDTTTLYFNLQTNNKTLAPINIVVTKPIEINGDTTSYNVASFKKGEKSIEALLKKLPGFEVDDKGRIKFKNKYIKKILLDGDDVIKDDYQVLSKNLTPDMVDKIQAIEHYESNELLAGISKGNETVLNLVINKNFKGVIYLKTSALTTLKDSLHQIEHTGLAIFKKLKMINVFNKDNIGKYSSSNAAGENDPGRSGSAALIDNDYLYHLNDKRSEKFNNSLVNNFNLLYKRKGLFEINTRYAYFSDIQTTANSDVTEYINTSPTVKLEENIKRTIEAKTHRVNLFVKVNTSRRSFFTVKADGQLIRSVLYNENKNTFDTLANKNTDTINCRAINLYFIKKLNSKNALEIEIGKEYKNNPQSLLITPGLYHNFFNTNDYDSIYQSSNFKERNWNSEFRITGYNKWVKYKFRSGYINQTFQYRSAIELLRKTLLVTADSLINNAAFVNKNIYLTAVLEKAFMQQKLNVKIENNFGYACINACNIENNPRVFYNPAISFDYIIGRFGRLSFDFTIKNSFEEYKNYVSNYFFKDYKGLEKNNIAEALIEKKKVYGLNYSNFNLYHRIVSIGTSYSKSTIFLNHYLQNYNEYYIERNEKLQAPVNNISWINHAIVNKVIRPLRNTFNFSLFYIFSKATTVQSNADISDFISGILSSNIGLISNFKGAINYEIRTGINYNKSCSHSNLFTNSFENLTYNVSTALNIKITENLKSHIDFKFSRNTITTCYLDADIEYDISKKGLAISAGGNNLFNNNKIVNYYATEFFIQRKEATLFPRFIYLKLAYNFSFKL